MGDVRCPVGLLLASVSVALSCLDLAAAPVPRFRPSLDFARRRAFGFCSGDPTPGSILFWVSASMLLR